MLRHMCVLLAATTLTGCGWFESSNPSPQQKEKLRPGVDRQAVPAGLPPAPRRGGYEGASASPLDETREQRVGAVVTGTGGQKVQLEALEKDRVKREAERNREKVEQQQRQTAQPAAPSAAPTTER